MSNGTLTPCCHEEPDEQSEAFDAGDHGGHDVTGYVIVHVCPCGAEYDGDDLVQWDAEVAA
ncbi:hypothetical protein BH23CHL8_BH23CHL8_30850 [soil metagenome]